MACGLSSDGFKSLQPATGFYDYIACSELHKSDETALVISGLCSIDILTKEMARKLR